MKKFHSTTIMMMGMCMQTCPMCMISCAEKPDMFSVAKVKHFVA